MPHNLTQLRSLAGCRPWGRRESDTTEWLTHTDTITWCYHHSPHIKDSAPQDCFRLPLKHQWEGWVITCASEEWTINSIPGSPAAVAAKSVVSDSVWPQMAAHQASPSLGFSRQEHRSGLPFPSPMHESKKWKWVSRFALTLLSRSECLQISWLQSPSKVIFEVQEKKRGLLICPFDMKWWNQMP